MQLPKAKDYKTGSYKYAHLKRDGNALIIEKDRFGRVKCETRTPTDITSNLRWCNWMAPIHTRVPNATVLFGELWVPGRKASYVKTAIKEHDHALRFDCFAIGTELPQAPLEHLRDLCERWGVGFIEWLEGDCPEPSGDVEGYVFKNGNLEDWHKWKPVKTADLTVCGIVDGKNANIGLVGSLICKDATGRTVCNAGGMTMEDRLEMTLHSPVGKIVEVAYQYVGSKGKLRHPRFIRFREDKETTDVISFEAMQE